MCGRYTDTNSAPDRCIDAGLKGQNFPELLSQGGSNRFANSLGASFDAFLCLARSCFDFGGDGGLYCFGGGKQAAQNCEVLDVFLQVFAFWGFKTAGMVREARVVDNVAKRFTTDFALADTGVAIDAGAEIRFRIVEMKCEHFLEADGGIEFV